MIVDEDGPAPDDIRDVACEMNLSDGFRRQRIQVFDRIDPYIVGAYMNVIDVAKKTAARSTGELAQKDGLAHR